MTGSKEFESWWDGAFTSGDPEEKYTAWRGWQAARATPPEGMAIVPAACMNPRLWTQKMHDAWHKNIPDVQAAFAAVLAAAKDAS